MSCVDERWLAIALVVISDHLIGGDLALNNK